MAAGEHGRYVCVTTIDERLELVTFYVYCPRQVPPEYRPAAAEFLTRANYRMRIGNFEMDLSDGEVRFKTQVIGLSPTMPALGLMVSSGVAAMDHFGPALDAVARGAASPADAVAQCED